MSVVIRSVKQEDNLHDSLKGSKQSKNLNSLQKVVRMWNKFLTLLRVKLDLTPICVGWGHELLKQLDGSSRKMAQAEGTESLPTNMMKERWRVDGWNVDRNLWDVIETYCFCTENPRVLHLFRHSLAPKNECNRREKGGGLTFLEGEGEGTKNTRLYAQRII